MTEDDVKKIAEQVYADRLRVSQNAPSQIAFHRHNGTDAPRVPADSLEYPLGYIILPNLTSVPTASVPGAVTMVNGKLYCFQTSSWVIVGTQT